VKPPRDWHNSPHERALREMLRRVQQQTPDLRPLRVDLSRLRDLSPPPEPEPPPNPKRRRAPGAGRKPTLTTGEIARGRELFRDALRRNPRLRREEREDQVKRVRALLGLRRNVGPDALLRHIIRPVDPRPR
jgi:hypothetical protein